MWASTLWPFSSSMRNIALGRGSTTRPSTSMAPSFLAILVFESSPVSFVASSLLLSPDERSTRWPYNVSRRQEIPRTGHARNQRYEAPLVHDTRIGAVGAKCDPKRGARGVRTAALGRSCPRLHRPEGQDLVVVACDVDGAVVVDCQTPRVIEAGK